MALKANNYWFAASIFAYGQTSSGKTYTMTGITEFAVADIFDYIFKVTLKKFFFFHTHYFDYLFFRFTNCTGRCSMKIGRSL